MLNTNVKVTIAPDGSTKFDFSGFEGASCLAEADALKDILASYGISTEQLEFEAKPELLAAQLENKQASEQTTPETHLQETTGE